MDFHPAAADVPVSTRSPRLFLRPLRASDAALDYEAVMSSAVSLRGWSQADWPADDFTLAENLVDLERHEREHHERQAFTFTVLDRDQGRCLGCVYIQPIRPEIAAQVEGASHAASVSFWVRSSEVASDLDRHLLDTLHAWLASAWAFDRVVFTIADREGRQAALLEQAGLERGEAVTLADGRRCRVYR